MIDPMLSVLRKVLGVVSYNLSNSNKSDMSCVC